MTLLPFGVLAAGCSSEHTSTAGQMLTCITDPGTGVVLRCEPGNGSGANTCQDVDEDGDGEPHDQGDDGDHSGTVDFAVTVSTSPRCIRWIDPYVGQIGDEPAAFFEFASGVFLVFDEA